MSGIAARRKSLKTKHTREPQAEPRAERRKSTRKPSQPLPQAESRTRREVKLCESPSVRTGDMDTYNYENSGALVQRRLSGYPEMSDHSIAPTEDQLLCRDGQWLTRKQKISAIDDWLDILKDANQKKTPEEIEKTLNLRRKYAPNGPKTLQEWMNRDDQEDSEEKKSTGSKSICDKYTCTTQLRL